MLNNIGQDNIIIETLWPAIGLAAGIIWKGIRKCAFDKRMIMWRGESRGIMVRFNSINKNRLAKAMEQTRQNTVASANIKYGRIRID